MKIKAKLTQTVGWNKITDNVLLWRMTINMLT